MSAAATSSTVPQGALPCLCNAIRRADRALSRRYDDALRPSGLTTTQYALLAALSRAGRPLPHGELAGLQEMAAATLTRALQPLQRDGLIHVASGDDRRTRFVAITAAGEAALSRARPLWQAVQQEVVAAFDDARSARLLADLARLVASLREDTT
ncbi:MAG: MarR family winged helix-turn-helix transcriptional regulator [Thermomicrobiales bacterium]